MPRTGNGTYILPAGNPVVPSTVIRSDWANSTLDDIAQALSGSISKDGQTSPTANLTMAGYRHTNVGDAQAANEYATARQVQSATLNRLTTSSSSTSTAYVATGPLNTQSFPEGTVLIFTPNVTSGPNPTLAVNGQPALPLLTASRSAITNGGLLATVPYYVRLSGSVWMVQSIQYGPLSVQGGTMLGDLILKGDPTSNFMAATKQYVDNATGSGGPPSEIIAGDSYARVTDTGTDGKMTVALNGAVYYTFQNGIATFDAQLLVGGPPYANGGAPNVRFLSNNTANFGTPANAGNTDVNVSTRFQNGSATFDFGTYASGACWLQTRNWNDFAVNFALALNPNGGPVCVNTNTVANWSGYDVLQVGDYASIGGNVSSSHTVVGNNIYWNGTAWAMIGAGRGTLFIAEDGKFSFYTQSTVVGAGGGAALINAGGIAQNGHLGWNTTASAFSFTEKIVPRYGGATGTCDWILGGTQLVTDQPMTVSFINIPASVMPNPSPLATHFVSCTNFDQVTWPGSVLWGVGGKPSIPGSANVMLSTFDGGATVYATVVWRNA